MFFRMMVHVFVHKWVEIIVEKAENAGYQRFLFFPTMFSKAFFFNHHFMWGLYGKELNFVLCNEKLFSSFKFVLYSLSAYIGTGQIMGWGNKAIEIRAAETGHLDGVFMHKKAQKLKFLCERNDKVGPTLCSLEGF